MENSLGSEILAMRDLEISRLHGMCHRSLAMLRLLRLNDDGECCICGEESPSHRAACAVTLLIKDLEEDA